MKTKAYVRFLNRAAHFEADIELVDMLSRAARAGRLHSPQSQHLLEFLKPEVHPRLAARENSDGNRKIAFAHLKGTLCSAFLKDIYEDFSSYLQEVIEAAARNGLDPNRLIGEHKVTFEANDLLKCKSWEAVVSLVSNALFRRLENEKSTRDLLAKFNAKLNLGVVQAAIDDALPYLEMRHLLVHADGVADEAFCRQFPTLGLASGAKIPMTNRVLQAAKKAIHALVAEIDAKVIQNNVVATADTQP